MIRFFTLSIILVISFQCSLSAQNDLSSSFLREAWVSTFNNPAWVPEKKVHIGLPTLFVGGGVSNIDLESMLLTQGDSTVVDLEAVMNTVGDEVRAGFEVAAHPVYFSMAFGSYRIGLEYSINHHTSIGVPGDLVKFLAKGNAPFADRVLNLGPNLYSTTYHKFSIPFSYERENWTFGIRASLLKGVAALSTERSQLELTSDMDKNEMYVQGDYMIQSSALLAIDTSSSLGASLNEDFIDDLFTTNNTGFSLDVGVRFQPTEKISLGASMTGIGKIKWNQSIVNLSTTADATIEGVTFRGLEDGVEIDEEAGLDSLINAVDFFAQAGDDFSTALPQNIYLTASIWLNEFLEGGVVAYGQFVNGNFDPAFAINARLHASVIAIGLSYGMKYNQFTNLGANLTVQVGPAQLFAATDNILTAFKPKAFPSSSARVGLAIAFGKDKMESE